MKERRVYIRFEREPKSPAPPILGGILMMAGIVVGLVSSPMLGGLLMIAGAAASSTKEGK